MIPDKYFYSLLHLKKKFSLQNFKSLSYSGDGEDILLQRIFKDTHKGVYVDVGAFHPHYLSNTYLLYKAGWRGVNIDPNKNSIKLFNKYRPADLNLLTGISEDEKELTYYNFTHSGVNTFDREHANKKENANGNRLVDTQKLQCVPLRKILSEHLDNTEIDLLDVDVEGMDLEVLKSNDWKVYRPKVILVEDREFREKMTGSKIYTYLVDKGYAFYAYHNITLVMMQKGYLQK